VAVKRFKKKQNKTILVGAKKYFLERNGENGEHVNSICKAACFV